MSQAGSSDMRVKIHAVLEDPLLVICALGKEPKDISCTSGEGRGNTEKGKTNL